MGERAHRKPETRTERSELSEAKPSITIEMKYYLCNCHTDKSINTMIRNLIVSILLLCFAGILHAQDDPLLKRWSFNTAYLMPAGKWESGILQPFRYGINPKLEVYTHGPMLPFIPEAGVKVAWGIKNDFVLASEHSLSVPTPFLNVVSRKGIVGLI